MDTSLKEKERRVQEIEAARQRLLTLVQHTPPQPTSTSEVVVGNTRTLLDSVGKFAYATSPVEFSKSISEMCVYSEKLLKSAKGVSELSEDEDVQKAIWSTAVNTIRTVVDLLEVGKSDRDDPGAGARMDEATAAVAAAVNAFLYSLKRLPDADGIPMEEPGTDDLEAKAEKELLKCAQIIAEAAKTLMSNGQRNTNKASMSLDQEDINEAILDAARMITEATGNLVKRAAVAQQERRQTHRKEKGLTYHADPMWANGLISGAQSVAGSVQQLVKAANAASEGHAEEVALVASAQGVATATAHLLTAARAKADLMSEAQRKLGDAAGSVTSATKQLVMVARAVGEFEDADDELDVNWSAGTGGIRLEMEQQGKISKLERQLEQERRNLMDMRRLRYKK